MYTLIAENQYGERLELTHNPAYAIIEIDGLDPPDADINTTRNAGADGSIYNSAYMNERQVIISLAVNAPAEANRINLYKYFKARFPVRLYYSNASRDVYIDGYVQSMPIGFFDKKQTVQIVIQCPQPLLNGQIENVQEFSSIESLFEFPFSIPAEGIEFSAISTYVEKSIVNNGDVDTGVIISVRALGTVVNPRIYNADTRESFILNVSMSEGDEITINTRRGEKNVSMISDGVTTNIVGYLEEGSTWFQLIPGDNLFTIAADSMIENMLVTFTIIDQFEGV